MIRFCRKCRIRKPIARANKCLECVTNKEGGE